MGRCNEDFFSQNISSREFSNQQDTDTFGYSQTCSFGKFIAGKNQREKQFRMRNRKIVKFSKSLKQPLMVKKQSHSKRTFKLSPKIYSKILSNWLQFFKFENSSNFQFNLKNHLEFLNSFFDSVFLNKMLLIKFELYLVWKTFNQILHFPTQLASLILRDMYEFTLMVDKLDQNCHIQSLGSSFRG